MNSRHARGRDRAGFALIVVLVAIAILAVLLVVLSVEFIHDRQRSERELAHAQLREVLIAGEATMAAALAESGSVEADRPIALPGVVELEGIELVWQGEAVEGTTVHGLLIARSAMHQQTQQVSWEAVEGDDGWRLVEARLNPRER